MSLNWHGETFKNNLMDELKDYINVLTEKVYVAIKEECPVATGHLRDSHEMEVNTEDTIITGIISANTDYALEVNLGTSKQGSNPYMIKGLNEVKNDV